MQGIRIEKADLYNSQDEIIAKTQSNVLISSLPAVYLKFLG